KVKQYNPDYFMTQNEACQQIIYFIQEYKSQGKSLYGLSADHRCIAVARVGSDTQKIVYKPLEHLVKEDLGEPLHSLVIPGKMNEIDVEIVEILCK
ncbi:MAG: diphthine synthase, partial [Paramarteilia canceri]